MRGVAQYIGVAAPTELHEIQQLREFLDRLRWPADVGFMNGPLVSSKTLAGEEASKPSRYPPIAKVANLLIEDPRFFNVIHFNSRDPQLFRQLDQLARLPGRLHGIQLNIVWPPVAELAKFRQHYLGEISLILQLSRKALDVVNWSGSTLVASLQPYEGLVEYILIDPSGGEGKPYDPGAITPLLTAVRDSDLSMRTGVTGGLCADRCWALTDLLNIYPGLCWDAESLLRTPGDDTTLDMGRCYGFLAASRALLS